MPTFTPSKTAVRDQIHGVLLRLSGLITFQAIHGSPEGVVPGTRGDLVSDVDTATLWIKTTGTPGQALTSTGWIVVGGTLGVGGRGSIGWSTPTTPVVQVGSSAGFVNIQGPGVFDPSVDFVQSGANALQYTGSGGTFFVRSQASLNINALESVILQMQISLNGGHVPNSIMPLLIASTASQCLVSSAQITLATGDVIATQVYGQGASVDIDALAFRMQISPAA